MHTRLVEWCLGRYMGVNRRIWVHLPQSVRRGLPGRAYGRHVHSLVTARSERGQNHATFFLRNRPELELMRRLVDQKAPGSRLDITVLACSKGAEVYSVLWALRSARPDLAISTQAVDISEEILKFAEQGVYSRGSAVRSMTPSLEGVAADRDVTWRDQDVSIFERLTDQEMAAMFEVTGDQARIRPLLKEGITWRAGDAADPTLVDVLGPQDIVVANRFLCHMQPAAAEQCLRNIGRLVKRGGYLFVSGVDLDVRTRVARSLGWHPVEELMREIHEGDFSLHNGWPLEWWGLEPFSHDLSDWRIRYASVFRIPLSVSSPFGSRHESATAGD